MDFKNFKKTNKTSNISNLLGELDKMTSGKAKYIDDRFWSPGVDEKTGNGTAVIRFLPATKEDALPWVSVFSHSFQGPGGWYIENSLTTLGQPDPVSETNSELWATGIEANKEIVRKRKRKQNFIANVLVISDPKNPQNEGKVFLYKFGKKIFGKIQEKLKPEFADEAPVDVFNFWTGANFRLKIKTVEGYPNYDSSTFDSPTALFDGDDDKLETLWKSQFDLSEFTSQKNFKTYDELKAKLDKVLGRKGASMAPAASPMAEAAAPVAREAKPAARKETPKSEVPWSSGGDDEDDEAMSYFKNLADE